MPGTKRPGETALARQFFAGAYAEVVRQTFDAEIDIPDADLAFVVGALTFVGRVEDAEICFDGRRVRGTGSGDAELDARTAAASRFFLGLAAARAGDFERAHRLLAQGARGRARAPDAWVVAFVFQGLACLRYFTGRYRAAARHALRAQRAAHVAHFAYAQMLATDLRGHALAQVGQFRAAVALLEQAKLHSERVGFGMNAYAIECSIANYDAKHVARPTALARIEALLQRRSHDSYSKRALLAESAIQLALRGRASEAAAALDDADADALRQDSRRAKLTNLVARLHVLRWSQGAAACAELVAQARELAVDADVALRAELLGFDAWARRRLGQDASAPLDELASLSRTHEHYRARAVLAQLATEPLRSQAFAEDELAPLLHAVSRGDTSVLHRLLGFGLLGAVPECLGLAPGERIHLLAAEGVLLLESHGDVVQRAAPPRWCAALLRVLASGEGTKENIVSALWGLRAYRPERHDPLIRTTIHRLRALLAPYGQWVVVTESGYGCSVPVHITGASEHADLETPLVEGEAPVLAAPPRRAESTALDESNDARVLAKLVERAEPLAVKHLVDSLGLSESTIQRALRVLLQKKRIVRMGHARSTRYEARR